MRAQARVGVAGCGTVRGVGVAASALSGSRVALALLVVVSLGPLTRASAQEKLTSLSLDEAIRVALEANPTLRAEAFEYQATRAGEITAGLRPNPTASYSAEQVTFGPATDASQQHTVIVSQTIETGGKREHRLASARSRTRVERYQFAEVRRQTILRVEQAFNSVLVAQASLALATDNLKTLDEVERIQRVRAEKGDISELELLRIQVARFDFERDAADARQALRTAEIQLRTAVGPARVAEPFVVKGELVFHEMAIDRNEFYRTALANRPDVLAAKVDSERAQADLNLARANAWWDITPQLEYQRIGVDNTLGFGVSIPIRIFDRNQGEIARTRAEIDRAQALSQAAAQQALADVDTALAGLETDRNKLLLLRDTYLPKAARARDTVQFAYERGGASLLDFLDAVRSYRQTALAHLQALGAYQNDLYQLEAAVGGSRAP